MRLLYIALFFLGLFTACVDSSEDVYGERLEIRVENIDQDIRVNIGSSLNISPKIYPEDRNYECFWGVANRNNQYSIIDTLSHERDLDYLVTLNTGSYTLRFCAKDTETGIFSYTEYNLFVETDMSTGWWVLKSNENGTDVDIFTDEKKIENVVHSYNGKTLTGNAVDLAYTTNYFVFDASTDTDVNKSVVFLGSEEDLMVVDLFTGKILRTYEDLFYEFPAQRKIQAVFKGASDVHLLADGSLYTMPISRYTPHYKQFVIKHGGDYVLSPYRVASGWSNPMLFDESTSSFCIADRAASELVYGKPEASPSHSNLNMELLYMGGRTTSTNGGENGYALLKVKGEEKYKLAYIDATRSTYDLNSSTASRHCIILDMKDIPNTLGLLKSEIRAQSQDNDIMYFVKDNQVYSCHLETFDERLQTTEFSAGETITYMEYTKFMQPYNDTSKWFNYLMVGTKTDNGYKLYFHPIQAGTLQPAVKVFEGEGEVKRAIYIGMIGGYVYPSVYF
ncbi:MAG: hypothetical protein IJY59_08820 [Bacteroidaceae bacterium]|nr:hypothetical protein [Bacteroidaceae bacterium]